MSLYPVLIRGHTYLVSEEEEGVLYDRGGNRLSDATILTQLGLTVAEAYPVLMAICHKNRTPDRRMTSELFHKIVLQNLAADQAGHELSPSAQEAVRKGINYAILKPQDAFTIADVLERMRSMHRLSYRWIRVPYHDAHRADFGRLARYARLPWTRTSPEAIETIPLLVQPLTEHLVRSERP